MELIDYGRQWIDDQDIAAVTAVLRGDFLTQGPAVEALEEMICEITGARYCVAMTNGTAALHLAVAALQLAEGSVGITTPNTFVASANCLLYNGHTPRFVDIDASSYNIDVNRLEGAIDENVKVLIPVHFAGRPVDMERLAAVAKRHQLAVIEDCAHAIGGKYADGRNVGCCHRSDMAMFSFHPVKTVTTGEGGAITTNNPDLYRRLRLLRTHGITKDPQQLSANVGPWYYEMIDLGFNFRLTDLQAALGCSQLRRLVQFVARRTSIVEHYNRAFGQVAWLRTPQPEKRSSPAYHLYVLQIDFTALGKERAAVMAELRAAGVGSQVHYIPVHTHPYFMKRFGYAWGDFPVAEQYYRRTLSIPLYPKMTDQEVERVIQSVLGLADAQGVK